MYRERYIYDAMYGIVRYPEYVWRVIPCPELQRLREVRLCNINSLCLTGGANTNRYEHALGTAYLAIECLNRWPLKMDRETERMIVLAALLHDTVSTAFGHSVQYVLTSEGFRHESFRHAVSPQDSQDSARYGYRLASFEPIHFGMQGRLHKLLSEEEIIRVDEIIRGTGPFGPLINGTIDLDNIDNVYRLAYHYGFVRDRRTPIGLASSIWVENGQLVVREDRIPSLQEWYEARQTLYQYLLLNPEEFSAKCMLEEALQIAQQKTESHVFRWHDVDYEILVKLADCSAETGMIVRRLMIGDLYGCIGIYSTSSVDAYDKIINPDQRKQIEGNIANRLRSGVGHSDFRNTDIAVHAIKDVNKTRRQIRILTSAGREVEIGESSSQVLIGVFFRNVNLSMLEVRPHILEKWNVRQLVLESLEELLNKHEDTPRFKFEEVRLYGEAADTNG